MIKPSRKFYRLRFINTSFGSNVIASTVISSRRKMSCIIFYSEMFIHSDWYYFIMWSLKSNFSRRTSEKSNFRVKKKSSETQKAYCKCYLSALGDCTASKACFQLLSTELLKERQRFGKNLVFFQKNCSVEYLWRWIPIKFEYKISSDP